jgi:hypothetical protein
MPKPNALREDPVPTRLRLPQAVARAVARSLFDKLVGGWGLVNAGKIVSTLEGQIKAERKRRKELDK